MTKRKAGHPRWFVDNHNGVIGVYDVHW
jgi:hypothetical protein